MTGEISGKIVLAPSLTPHESRIRKLQAKGAAAVVFLRKGNYPPGFTMYLVDGRSRSDLYLPTMEAVIPHSRNNLFNLPEGSFVQCIPTENLHKKAHDTKFQFVMNLVQSFWEMAIIGVASLRIYQFYFLAHVPLLSIAPVCCAFEAIGAAIRLSLTCVDPFQTYRMLPQNVGTVLATLSWPFSEAAGILLCFFCTYLFSKCDDLLRSPLYV